MPRYKMKFKKSHKPYNKGYYTVTDSSLILVLAELQKKYIFEVVSTKFNDYYNTNYIKIKCDKSDKCKIFTDFCILLNGEIKDVSF